MTPETKPLSGRITSFFLTIWYMAIFTLIGAIFNTTIAFLSLFFSKVFYLTVPGLTGYAIYKLIQRSKSENIQSSADKSREQSQQS